MTDPKVKIEYVPIDSVHEWEKNPRLIKDKRFTQLVKSIKNDPSYMESRALLVQKSTGNIYGGNMRFRACKELGWKEVPVIIDDIDDTLTATRAIKDNSSFGEYDDSLSAILDELEKEGVDLDELGLSAAIEALQLPPAEIVEDEVPEPKKDPQTGLGDLWQLGDHRLLCGDATNIEHVERLMNGNKADQVVTDPPYNVDYEGKGKEALKIENDKMSDDSFRQFLRDSFSTMDAVMKDGAVFYIWHADSEGYNFRGACHDVGWKVRQCLIWNKNSMVMGRQDYHWKHEPCLYGWKEGAGHLWATDRKQTTILEFSRPTVNKEHPTMKPIALIAYLISNNTKGQDLVLDLFGGSGSTLMACEQLNRKCYMMELDPQYVRVIIDRWENLTGNKAVLLTGK